MERGVSRRRQPSEAGSTEVVETTLARQPAREAEDDGTLSPLGVKRVIRDWCGSKSKDGEYQAVCHATGATPFLLLMQMLADPNCPLPPRVRADMLMELTKTYVAPPPKPVTHNEDEEAPGLSLGGFTIMAGVQAPDGTRVMTQLQPTQDKTDD